MRKFADIVAAEGGDFKVCDRLYIVFFYWKGYARDANKGKVSRSTGPNWRWNDLV